jgi:hypothetical protein
LASSHFSQGKIRATNALAAHFEGPTVSVGFRVSSFCLVFQRLQPFSRRMLAMFVRKVGHQLALAHPNFSIAGIDFVLSGKIAMLRPFHEHFN